MSTFPPDNSRNELPAQSSGTRSRRVLIVDDDRDLAESLQDILDTRGFETATAFNAKMALDTIKSFSVDVALLDIKLGRDYGVDLIEPIKAAFPDVVCVLMTAHAEVETAIKALRSGVYDYLHKPVDPIDMLATLARCFEKIDGERQAAETLRALRQAKEAAEVASVAKSCFLANMSHELRTPLNAVIGFSEIIMSEQFGPPGDPRYLGYAKDIYQSGHHLLAIVNDVLDLAKVEAGHFELEESDVDLGAVIKSAIGFVNPQAQRATVSVNAGVAPDLPLVLGDEGRLKQIILNLLSNAVKFSQKGGTVSVEVLLKPEGCISLSVRDSGIGMRQEDIAVALAPFGQVEGPMARRYQGTGLGLPLATKFTEMHGGKLHIESAPDKGTRVEIVLPESRVIKHRTPSQRTA